MSSTLTRTPRKTPFVSRDQLAIALEMVAQRLRKDRITQSLWMETPWSKLSDTLQDQWRTEAASVMHEVNVALYGQPIRIDPGT